MKIRKIKRYFLLFCLCNYFTLIIAQANITGPNWILPDVATGNFNANNIPQGAYGFNWTSNCSNVTISNNASTTTSITIPKTTSCNSFTLNFQYILGTGSSSVVTNLSYAVGILPFLKASDSNGTISIVYPGETFNVNAKTVNSGSAPYPCGSSPTPIWSFTGGSCGNCGSSSSSWSRTAVCNTTGILSSLLVDLSCGCTGVNGGAVNQLTQLSLNVKLRDPQIVGQASLGCVSGISQSGVTYSASTITGANYWVWNYDANKFNLLSGSNSSVITLDAKEVGDGTITVQSYYAANSSIKSSVMTRTITICCVSTQTFADLVSTNTGTLYHKQADVQLNTTNTITSAGGATMHAGNEVRLLPGFTSELGSEIHLYNLGCSGTGTNSFYRSSYNSSSDSTYILESNILISDDDLPITFKFKENDLPQLDKVTINDENNFNEPIVYPNPNSGEFLIQFENYSQPPSSIIIIDIMGNLIKKYEKLDSKKIVFSLNDSPDGIYILKFSYWDRVLTKCVIKNSK